MALWKSFTECFWPIFGLLENYEDCDPFVIGLYVGMSKPTNTDNNNNMGAYIVLLK